MCSSHAYSIILSKVITSKEYNQNKFVLNARMIWFISSKQGNKHNNHL